MTNFKDYIMARRVTDTPNGDFVADVKTDSHFPNVTSLEELSSYLRRRGACRKAIAAGKRVFRQFQAALKHREL